MSYYRCKENHPSDIKFRKLLDLMSELNVSIHRTYDHICFIDKDTNTDFEVREVDELGSTQYLDADLAEYYLIGVKNDE